MKRNWWPPEASSNHDTVLARHPHTMNALEGIVSDLQESAAALAHGRGTAAARFYSQQLHGTRLPAAASMLALIQPASMSQLRDKRSAHEVRQRLSWPTADEGFAIKATKIGRNSISTRGPLPPRTPYLQGKGSEHCRT